MSDATEQSPAEQQKPKVLINPPVFFTSVAIIAAMVLFSVIAPETAAWAQAKALIRSALAQ